MIRDFIASLKWIRKRQVRDALVLKKAFPRKFISCLQIFKHHTVLEQEVAAVVYCSGSSPRPSNSSHLSVYGLVFPVLLFLVLRVSQFVSKKGGLHAHYICNVLRFFIPIFFLDPVCFKGAYNKPPNKLQISILASKHQGL